MSAKVVENISKSFGKTKALDNISFNVKRGGYYIDIMRAVYLKGSTIADLWPNFVALGVFVIVINTLAAFTYKKQS